MHARAHTHTRTHRDKVFGSHAAVTKSRYVCPSRSQAWGDRHQGFSAQLRAAPITCHLTHSALLPSEVRALSLGKTYDEGCQVVHLSHMHWVCFWLTEAGLCWFLVVASCYSHCTAPASKVKDEPKTVVVH